MKTIGDVISYTDKVGGIYHDGNLEAIPYNHWRKDCEWLVLVIKDSKAVRFIPITAITSKDAAMTAIYKFVTEDKNETSA